MQDKDITALIAAIAALEGQRSTLGDAVLELAVAPLRARLAGLQGQVPRSGLQRRQVTVHFADVVGATAMANGMDAEDTLSVLSGALRRMAAVVEAHQGRVLRFTGDGVKAALGLVEAREDDPERAVRAGAEADNTAMGAAVNIAAHMEQSAPPGAPRISRDTFHHVRGLFDLETPPPLQVKGLGDPIASAKRPPMSMHGRARQRPACYSPACCRPEFDARRPSVHGLGLEPAGQVCRDGPAWPGKANKLAQSRAETARRSTERRHASLAQLAHAEGTIAHSFEGVALLGAGASRDRPASEC